MQLSLITPVSHLWMSHLLPGRFCLANIALQYEDYLKYFIHEQSKGRGVILDNGVFEADCITEEEYFMVTIAIQPDIVVAPDEIGGNAIENFESAKEFIEKLEKAILAQKEIVCPHTQVMFVPQTPFNDVESFGQVIEQFIKEPKMNVLGICRDACYNAFNQVTHTIDQELNRFYFGIWLQKTGLLTQLQKTDKKIHFLGIGDQVHMLQHYWYVDSADTASFFWQATQGNIITPEGMLPTIYKRPAGYFGRTFQHIDPSELYVLVEENCNKAQYWNQKSIDYRNRQTGGRI